MIRIYNKTIRQRQVIPEEIRRKLILEYKKGN